ncbi:MAG: hypothetical protein CMF75_08105 [Maricaulis sp.]|nr:hypothetical protein [Maricaulis sp.]|tara:strand:+ start:747 stop:947 length:201 start_codon:yes stop_codon:yes gene_type:complete
MAKADFALRVVAKSALLWLTAALLFASVFGALFSARPSGPSLLIAESSQSTSPEAGFEYAAAEIAN